MLCVGVAGTEVEVVETNCEDALLELMVDVVGGMSVCCDADAASLCAAQMLYALAFAASLRFVMGQLVVRQTRASSPKVKPLTPYCEHKHRMSPFEQSYC
jgi:hypothetical protein